MIPGFDDLTYYEILDISMGVDNKEIQEAYYRVRAAFSKNALASYSLYGQEEREQILRLIEEAYHILIDEHSKPEYDQKLSREKVRLAKEKKALQEALPLMPGKDGALPEVRPFNVDESERAGLTMDLGPDADEPGPEAVEEEEQTSVPDHESPETPDKSAQESLESLPVETVEEGMGIQGGGDTPVAGPKLEDDKSVAPTDQFGVGGVSKIKEASFESEAPAGEDRSQDSAETEPPAPAEAASDEDTGEAPAPESLASAASEPVREEQAEGPAPPADPPGPPAPAAVEPEKAGPEMAGAEAPPPEPPRPEAQAPDAPAPSRPWSIRDAQNARDRAGEGLDGPVRIQGRLVTSTSPSRERPPVSRPPAPITKPTDEDTQWTSKGREAFEETVYDLPAVKKSPTPLDFLDTSYSGTFLKQAREKKGLSLDKAWEVTRIRKAILAAMEDENYKALPADVFLRGMLIIYSRFLEIESPEAVAKGYMERLVASRDWMD